MAAAAAMVMVAAVMASMFEHFSICCVTLSMKRREENVCVVSKS